MRQQPDRLKWDKENKKDKWLNEIIEKRKALKRIEAECKNIELKVKDLFIKGDFKSEEIEGTKIVGSKKITESSLDTKKLFKNEELLDALTAEFYEDVELDLEKLKENDSKLYKELLAQYPTDKTFSESKLEEDEEKYKEVFDLYHIDKKEIIILTVTLKKD